MVASVAGVWRVLARAGLVGGLGGGMAQDFLRLGAPVLEVGESSSEQEGFREPRAAELNEPWRRVTGMTLVQEPTMDRKARRVGIARLVEKLKEYIPGEKALPSAEVWASEGDTHQVLLLFCQDYNISPQQLTLLTREYRGVTASELVDGLRVEPVQAALSELLKTYAVELWMSPGAYVNCLVLDKRLKICAGGEGVKSKYFVDPEEGWRKAEIYETRETRRAELLKAFDAGWQRGEHSREGFAASLGFRGFKELNRACLNVCGKSVRQVAYKLLCEIVEFYLAAEAKELRELACSDCADSAVTLRARFLYRGDCEKPEAPFWDFWEAQGRTEWLLAMEAWFRGPGLRVG